jgi:hypothetical protein
MFGDKLKVKEAAKNLCKATGTSQLFSLAGLSYCPLHLDALLIGFDFRSGRLMKNYL